MVFTREEGLHLLEREIVDCCGIRGRFPGRRLGGHLSATLFRCHDQKLEPGGKLDESKDQKKKSSVKIRPRTNKALDGFGTHLALLAFWFYARQG